MSHSLRSNARNHSKNNVDYKNHHWPCDLLLLNFKIMILKVTSHYKNGQNSDTWKVPFLAQKSSLLM
jgi:hypothetical protein